MLGSQTAKELQEFALLLPKTMMEPGEEEQLRRRKCLQNCLRLALSFDITRGTLLSTPHSKNTTKGSIISLNFPAQQEARGPR